MMSGAMIRDIFIICLQQHVRMSGASTRHQRRYTKSIYPVEFLYEPSLACTFLLPKRFHRPSPRNAPHPCPLPPTPAGAQGTLATLYVQRGGGKKLQRQRNCDAACATVRTHREEPLGVSVMIVLGYVGRGAFIYELDPVSK